MISGTAGVPPANEREARKGLIIVPEFLEEDFAPAARLRAGRPRSQQEVALMFKS